MLFQQYKSSFTIFFLALRYIWTMSSEWDQINKAQLKQYIRECDEANIKK
jgi:hypothetical protein